MARFVCQVVKTMETRIAAHAKMYTHICSRAHGEVALFRAPTAASMNNVRTTNPWSTAFVRKRAGLGFYIQRSPLESLMEIWEMPSTAMVLEMTRLQFRFIILFSLGARQ